MPEGADGTRALPLPCALTGGSAHSSGAGARPTSGAATDALGPPQHARRAASVGRGARRASLTVCPADAPAQAAGARAGDQRAGEFLNLADARASVQWMAADLRAASGKRSGSIGGGGIGGTSCGMGAGGGGVESSQHASRGDQGGGRPTDAHGGGPASRETSKTSGVAAATSLASGVLGRVRSLTQRDGLAGGGRSGCAPVEGADAGVIQRVGGGRAPAGAVDTCGDALAPLQQQQQQQHPPTKASVKGEHTTPPGPSPLRAALGVPRAAAGGACAQASSSTRAAPTHGALGGASGVGQGGGASAARQHVSGASVAAGCGPLTAQRSQRRLAGVQPAAGYGEPLGLQRGAPGSLQGDRRGEWQGSAPGCDPRMPRDRSGAAAGTGVLAVAKLVRSAPASRAQAGASHDVLRHG